MMHGKPFTIRLPEWLGNIIHTTAAKLNTSPSEVLRNSLEQSFTGDYRSGVAIIMQDNESAIRGIAAKLQPASMLDSFSRQPVSREEISAFMYFLHWAYMRESHYVNPKYIEVIFDILLDIFSFAAKEGVSLNLAHLFNKLHVPHNEPDFGVPQNFIELTDVLNKLRQEALDSPNAGYGEMVTCPIECMADSINAFSHQAITKIFNDDRLKTLLPVAVHGAIRNPKPVELPVQLRGFLPDDFAFDSGCFHFVLTANLALFVNGIHHCYVFSVDSTMAILGVIEQNGAAFTNLSDTPFQRNRLFIWETRDGNILLHEQGGYRLHLPKEVFSELCVALASLLKTKQWSNLLTYFRNHMGDI